MDYTVCVLFDEQLKKCGPYKPTCVEGIFVVSDLLEDVSEKLHISEKVTEQKVIHRKSDC